MKNYLFFDNASTTKCCEAAARELERYTRDIYGNPSSTHAFGREASKRIREARKHFAELFRVEPDQVIFTGSGTEADNLALYGVALPAIASRPAIAPRVIVSAIEHPAVKKSAQSLSELGFDVQFAGVDATGQVKRDEFERLLTPATVLVSLMRVNNIVGSILPVEELASLCKSRVPGVIFHTDAIQAFGKMPVPTSGSAVDLVSLSAHKIEGPKGIGALVVLNRELLTKNRVRPVIWGGGQESGLRSGTQSPGLISAFHAASQVALAKRESYLSQCARLRDRLRSELTRAGLLADGGRGRVIWNSPADAVPYIVNLSIPGYPSGPLTSFLEERMCLVSTGSACSSSKPEPEPVLKAMGLPDPVAASSIRVSFCDSLTEDDVRRLVAALSECLTVMDRLMGGAAGGRNASA